MSSPNKSDARIEARALEALDHALDLADQNREAYVAGLDSELESRVRRLLAVSEQPSQLDRGAVALAPQLVQDLAQSTPTTAHMIGRRIGAYELVGELGSGGMGRVYEARRADGQFEQQVALKVLRWDIEDSVARERFLRERQTLADLSHPQIPKLLDGGVTDDGLPYLVTEKVEGVPIDQFCGDKALSMRDRLELFVDTCRVVEAAHRQLVIHRDIKPSNILVDASGRPVLLDFGVAKLLAAKTASGRRNADLTETNAALTPKFAAPEQIEGQRITLSTDVYALGSLLHHLLLGAPIHSADDPTLGELLRRVTQDEAPIPSVQARSLSATPPGLGTAHELAASLKGDLDAILLRASSRKPEARYATAGEFADDVERFLHHQPVRARHAGLAHRARKALRRHWPVAVAAGVIAITIGLGVASTLWQARRAVQEAALAASEAKRANNVTELMTEVFDADVLDGNAAGETAKLLLERGVERAEQQLADQPELQVELLVNLASSFGHLGLHSEASATLQRATAIEEETAEPRAEFLVESALEGARNEIAAYGWIGAERWAEYGMKWIDSAPHLDLEDQRHRLRLEHITSLIEQQQLTKARGFLDAAAPSLRLLAQSDASVAERLDAAFAKLYRKEGNFEAAELHYRRALERAIEKAGDDGRVGASYYNNVAVIVKQLGRLDEAEEMYREALSSVTLELGPSSRQAQIVRQNLISLLHELGKPDEMLAFSREAFEFGLQVNAEGTWRRASTFQSRAGELALNGQVSTAMEHQRDAIENYVESIGPDHSWTLIAQALLHSYALITGEPSAADQLEVTLAELRNRPLNSTELGRQSLVSKVLKSNGFEDVARIVDQDIEAGEDALARRDSTTNEGE